MNTPVHDIDPQETQEWQEALEAVIAHEGRERAQYLMRRLIDQAQIAGVDTPYSAYTPYQNTIPTELEARPEGNPDVEERLQAFVRWNAMAMVLKANKESSELGGHIASYASSALLYEVGVDRVVLAWPVRAPIAIIQVCSGLDKCFYLSQIAQVVAGDKERAPSAHGTALQRAVDGRRDEARLLGEPCVHAFHRCVLKSSYPKMFYLSVQRMRPYCGISCRSRADSR